MSLFIGSLLQLQTASCTRTFLQGRGCATRGARGIFAFRGRGSLRWQGTFLVEQPLPARVHHGHDIGKILRPHAQVDAHSTGVAGCLAGILTIQDGGNVCCETGIQDLFGLRDPRCDARDDLRLFELLEGFVFGHPLIVAYLAIELNEVVDRTVAAMMTGNLVDFTQIVR